MEKILEHMPLTEGEEVQLIFMEFLYLRFSAISSLVAF